MKIELRKGNLVDRVSLQGELSEVIEKLRVSKFHGEK